MIDLNKFAKEVHENAVNHGWWDGERELPELIALMHSELSEALEEYRNGKPMVYNVCGMIPARMQSIKDMLPCRRDACPDWHGGTCEDMCHKPEGVAVELIDCIIRILDCMGKMGLDVEKLLEMKHEYNVTRPYKHGGKVC